MRSTTRLFWLWMLAVFFIAAGANHFLKPEPYVSMMPSYLPWPGPLVRVSGVAEIMGGLGLLFSKVRVFSGWGLIVLLIAVFPANLNVAIHGWPGVNLPQWSLWLRLPLQLVMIWWVYRVTLTKEAVAKQNKSEKHEGG